MDAESFGERLRLTLEERAISVARVAATLEVSPQAVHKWIKGGEISLDNLRALGSLLGVNWLWLRYGNQLIQELDINVGPGVSGGFDAVTKYRQSLIDEMVKNHQRSIYAQQMLGFGSRMLDLLRDTHWMSEMMYALFAIPRNASLSRYEFFNYVVSEDIPAFLEGSGPILDGLVKVDYGIMRPKATPDKPVEYAVKIVERNGGKATKVLGIYRRLNGEPLLSRLIEADKPRVQMESK